MKQHSVAAYSLRVRPKREKEYEQLDSIDGRIDLFETVQDTLEALGRSYSHDEEGKELTHVSKIVTGRRELHGIIRTGDYGQENELYNVNAKKTSYIRKNDDAELIPFYFLIQIPKSRDEGVLILHRVGNLGIQQLLLKTLRNKLATFSEDHVVEIKALVPEDLVKDKLQKSRMTKIRLVRFTVPKDVTDALGIDHEEVPGEMELVIKVKRSGNLAAAKTLKDIIEHRRGVKRLLEIGDLDFEHVKVEIIEGGRPRTVHISDIFKMQPYFDITDEIRVGNDGHPTLDSVNTAARSILEELNQALGRDA